MATTALEYIKKRKNVLITGPAGTGKSYLIKNIKELANEQDDINPYHIAITAMTGIASFIIGGTTLHSWAGIGLGAGDAEHLANKIKLNFHAKIKWWKTKILVIDEVSMLTAELFEKLEKIARLVRGNNRPFGGIQVILSGDFCQLPPIDKEKDVKYCFESDMWHIIDKTVIFDKIYRQDDPILQNCLNQIRLGQCSEDVETIIRNRMNLTYENDDGIKPTKLYAHRAAVDDYNKKELYALSDDSVAYEATYEIGKYKKKKPTQKQIEKTLSILDKNAPYSVYLELALGAQVVLLVNLDISLGLVNGSRGIVTSFNNSVPIVKFMNEIEMPIVSYSWEHEGYQGGPTYIRKQIPLKLAWATTIHKSQGQTLDLVEVDIGDNIFECGQTYVALSRVKTLEGLFIKSFNPDKIRTNPRVLEFYSNT